MEEAVKFDLVLRLEECEDLQTKLVHGAFSVGASNAQRIVVMARRARREGRPHVKMICTPAQFGRFVILRNDFGLKNGFMELDPVLQPVPEPGPLFDVRP